MVCGSQQAAENFRVYRIRQKMTDIAAFVYCAVDGGDVGIRIAVSGHCY
jgi:hypothetical protein